MSAVWLDVDQDANCLVPYGKLEQQGGDAEPGPKGPDGPAGDQGPAGDPGPDGADGENGTPYAASSQGTFTPTLVPGGGSITLNAGGTHGFYYKHGRFCFIAAYVTVQSVGSPTGALTLGGIPTGVFLKAPVTNTPLNAFAVTTVTGGTFEQILARILSSDATLLVRFGFLSSGVLTNMANKITASTTIHVAGCWIEQP